jgi:hypothetical protein
MVRGNVFGINNTRANGVALTASFLRIFAGIARQVAQIRCGLHGHLIMLHFEPHKLSLQCSFCGFETEGWEVGRPLMARRQANNPQARPDRRRQLRPLPTSTRLAS